MTTDNELLAEYVGVCWHEQRLIAGIDYEQYECKHCDALLYKALGDPACLLINPDFTTGNGWDLIAAKITEKEEWEAFYFWLQLKAISDAAKANDTSRKYVHLEGCVFHEKSPAEKSAIFAQYLEEKAND